MTDTNLTTPAELAGQAYATAVREKAHKLKQELIRQTLEDSTSWTKAINDKWANDHPGEWDAIPISTAEADMYRERVRTQDYEWVVPSFERFLDPDPDALNPVIESLARIEGMLEGRASTNGAWVGASPALGRINDVRVEMAFWEGAFKDNFIDHLVTPLETVVPNQRELIRYSRNAVEGAKVVHIRFRKSVLAMLDNAIRATQQLSNSACTGADAMKWGSIALCVIGTAGGALAAGGAALAAAVVVDIVGTIGGGLVPQDQEQTKLDLAADTATEVAAKIMSAQSVLGNDTYLAEEDIVTSLRDLHRGLTAERTRTLTSNRSGPFGVATPALADATASQITSGSFRPRR
ncbi:hypothetical protein [Actinoplanes derwentensis]|uniref:Uncharacterized protein n=1 Tax=Actinoplanes derwentensis TaxID=113562 RepID=A0A1H2CA44_9ACTN|nr:hypothetical protein [Actinoplanes derwentensis]GID89050.1 hypothetical protein Ade03nite_79740 [Actinoplanes derwentensis]SDT67425.1 hypothetical protein SAMN04489716_5472 [Actinoplanes derwentensis]